MGRGAPPPDPAAAERARYRDLMDAVVQLNLLPRVLKHLAAELRPAQVLDLWALTRVDRQLWGVLAEAHARWRELYLASDPLVTAEVRKRLAKDSYTRGLASLSFRLPRSGLAQSHWARCCTRLFAKPRLVLVMAGTDPVVMRRLGEPESAAVLLNLGIKYNLDDNLDDASERFAAEFPQVWQELDEGDLVVTQDFRGAGLFTAHAHPDAAPFMRLRKGGRDGAGFGILGKELAPPFFPLLYYCDSKLEDTLGRQVSRKELLSKSLYWFSYTLLADKSVFNWESLECDASL